MQEIKTSGRRRSVELKLREDRNFSANNKTAPRLSLRKDKLRTENYTMEKLAGGAFPCKKQL